MNSQNSDDELDNLCARCGEQQCDCERRGAGFEDEDDQIIIPSLLSDRVVNATNEIVQSSSSSVGVVNTDNIIVQPSPVTRIKSDEESFFQTLQTIFDDNLIATEIRELIQETRYYRSLVARFENDDVNDYRSYADCSLCGTSIQRRGMKEHQKKKSCLKQHLIKAKVDKQTFARLLKEFEKNELKTPNNKQRK